MKSLRYALLVLPLLASGCILVSGQFLVNFDLGTIQVNSPTDVVGRDVDLNDIGDYNDHKDELKGLADVAVLGMITNQGTEAIDVDIWMTPDFTSFTDAASVQGTGVRLWGPLHLDPGESRRVDWDTSAGLFDPLGKTTLLGEVKGDGQFTVYALARSGNYQFSVTEGQVVLVLDAGK